MILSLLQHSYVGSGVASCFAVPVAGAPQSAFVLRRAASAAVAPVRCARGRPPSLGRGLCMSLWVFGVVVAYVGAYTQSVPK